MSNNPYDRHPGQYALGTDDVFRQKMPTGVYHTADFPDDPFPVGTVVVTHGLEGTVHQRLRSTGLFHPVTSKKPISYDELRTVGNVVVLMFGADS